MVPSENVNGVSPKVGMHGVKSPKRVIFPIIHSPSFQQDVSEEDDYRTNISIPRRNKEAGNYYQLASKPKFLDQFSSTPPKPMQHISILRRKTSSQSSLSIISEDDKCCEIKAKIPYLSVSSISIPSLVSSNSLYSEDYTQEDKRSTSNISFNPRVWVYEYTQEDDNKWYNPAEIEQFKQSAIALIQEREVVMSDDIKVFFNHPALVSGCTASSEVDQRLDANISIHIKHILIVLEDELFIKIFKRAFEYMFPRVLITLSQGNDAMDKINDAKNHSRKATHGYDIILIGEFPNSTFISKIAQEREEISQESTFYFQGEKISLESRYTLLIGLSQFCGADLVIDKNLMSMDRGFRNDILYLIMKKRNVGLYD